MERCPWNPSNVGRGRSAVFQPAGCRLSVFPEQTCQLLVGFRSRQSFRNDGTHFSGPRPDLCRDLELAQLSR